MFIAVGASNESLGNQSHKSWSGTTPKPRAFLESPARGHHGKPKHALCVPYVTPPEASAASVDAAYGSTLASLGTEVLARGRFPGCDHDFVAVRATTALDVRRCQAARVELVNLMARAKRTSREVEFAKIQDTHDANPKVSHIYVTYDHPSSRHTLGVARFVPPSDRNPAGDDLNKTPAGVLDGDLDCFRAAQHPDTCIVDHLFATGLATVPHPVESPKFVQKLLLEACRELVARCDKDKNENARNELVMVSFLNHKEGLGFQGSGYETLDAVSSILCSNEQVPRLGLTRTQLRLVETRRQCVDAATTDTPLSSELSFAKTESAKRAPQGVSASSARRLLATTARHALGLNTELLTQQIPSDEDLAAAIVEVTGGLREYQKVSPFDSNDRETVDALRTFVESLSGGDVNDLTDQNSKYSVTLAVCDRITAGVDSKETSARNTVVSFLQRVAKENPKTLALVLHVRNEVDEESGYAQLCVRVNVGGVTADAYGDPMRKQSQPVKPKKYSFCNPFKSFSKKKKEYSGEEKNNSTPKINSLPLSDFLLTCASVGFVMDVGGCGCLVDNGGTFAAVHLVRPGYCVRFGVMSDVDTLVSIEKENWNDQPDMRTSCSTIASRIEHNPYGNLVVVDDQSVGEKIDDRAISHTESVIRGGVYFQRTVSLEIASSFPWLEKEKARDVGETKKPYVQLLDIHVSQKFSQSLGRAVGNELRAFVLNVSMWMSGVEGVCAVTRTRGYQKRFAKTNETYDQYVQSDFSSKRDRGLFFHTGGGAVVVAPVHNWRPHDTENDGKGTLIEYPLVEIQRERWDEARRNIFIRDEDENEKENEDDEVNSEYSSDTSEAAVVVEVSFTELFAVGVTGEK